MRDCAKAETDETLNTFIVISISAIVLNKIRLNEMFFGYCSINTYVTPARSPSKLSEASSSERNKISNGFAGHSNKYLHSADEVLGFREWTKGASLHN